MLFVCEGVVNSYVSFRRYNVEFRVEDVDVVYNLVEVRYCECLMVFILFNSFCVISNFLVCVGDDEVGVIYCN